MPIDSDGKHRRSIRLPEYDYASASAYFVTMVAQGRESIFGEIRQSAMHLSKIGEIVAENNQHPR
jgi:putative transposase